MGQDMWILPGVKVHGRLGSEKRVGVTQAFAIRAVVIVGLDGSQGGRTKVQSEGAVFRAWGILQSVGLERERTVLLGYG